MPYPALPSATAHALALIDLDLLALIGSSPLGLPDFFTSCLSELLVCVWLLKEAVLWPEYTNAAVPTRTRPHLPPLMLRRSSNTDLSTKVRLAIADCPSP